jgi:hypothetical protein
MKLLDDLEADDPILSVVNLIDIFLVIIAALLLTVAQNPLNPFERRDVTVVSNPGQPDMEIVIKKGEKVERYRTSEQLAEGDGTRAGIAYRLKDGSIIYVPESDSSAPGSRR